MTRQLNLDPNLSAFLDTLSEAEGTYGIGDDGYDVLVGSTPTHPILFASYETHPDILNHALNSTAAGRYQLLFKYYQPYAKLLGLTDFGPLAQDRIAVQQIRERGAIPHIIAGQFDEAVAKCNTIWASLTGSPYGQHTRELQWLRDTFQEHGGIINEV